ncbi:MAG: hypothetical protein KJ747_11290 [Actinobacteria bacterium]|nr:hypothetical protein [Actinomycetota bacterium]MCG2807598.1 hypothetical protein [Coriobacteriia bacterium]
MDTSERVSLRRFAQFAVTPRAQRRNLVIGHRQTMGTPWSPITDPYRFLINSIVRMHETGRGLELLDEAVNRERTLRRRTVIRDAAADYSRWLLDVGQVDYFPAPVANWFHENTYVRVNPEVGLEIGGQRYLVKLHFTKGTPVSRDEAAIMTGVMRAAIGDAAPTDCRMAVLDVRRGTLFIEPRNTARPLAVARRAAMQFAEIWAQTL